MTEAVCAGCGAPAPRWIRWVDKSILDFFHRVMKGFPGPTAVAVNYCEKPACAAKVEAEYGPAGNRAAFHRLTDELAAKGLDADDNEVRLAALCAVKLDAGHFG